MMEEVMFSEQQIRHLSSQVKKTLESDPRFSNTEIVGGPFTCVVCVGALNIPLGGAIAAVIVAGVAVGPEALVVVGIVAALDAIGVTILAATVASIITGAIGGGAVATVEGVIAEICTAAGACG